MSRTICTAAASATRCWLRSLKGQSAGFRQMIAVIGDSTRQAAPIGLHEALGFRHVGILQDVGFKYGRWLDTVLMQRALGDGGTTQP